MTALAEPALPIRHSSGEPPLLDVEHAVVRFEKLTAVRDVSLRMNGGQLLGLIGPNGAGKTTLLRAIAGIQTLSRGSVKIMGESAAPDSDHRRHIGFTPDSPPVYEEMTVRHFLRFIAKGYDLSANETDEKIDFWLDKVWLTDKAAQKIKGLSRGMRQRLGIARTLLPGPNVVLLDEPAAGLDPAGRVQFRQLLCSLRDQGKALIVSSHILADMGEYCTHIGIMSAGKLIQLGTVAEVAGSHDGERRRYTLKFAHPVARLGAAIGEIDGVEVVEADGDAAMILVERDADAAARVLGELVRRGLPLCSFAPNAADLEEAYLRTGIRQVD